MANAIPGIPYSELKPYRISNRLPALPLPHIQRTLLVGTLVCAILSLIPSLGWFGALSLRTLSLTMVGVQVIHSLKNKEKKEVILLQIMRLASVALGLIGVATHINLLVVSAVGLDILFQLSETGRGTQQKDIYKTLSHVTFIIIDTFVMTALLTGGWQFAVTAASLSSAAMFFFGLKAICDACRKNDLNYALDAVCYFALGGIGIASAVRSAEIVESRITSYDYIYKNTTDHTVSFYDESGHLVAQAEPGQTISFNVASENTQTVFNPKGAIRSDATGNFTYFSPSNQEWSTFVIQKPMTVDEFPTLPIGSGVVITQEPKWNPRAVEAPQNIDNEALATFLNPALDEFHSCSVHILNHPTITFTSEIPYIFDLQSVCAMSEYICGMVSLGGHSNTGLEIELDCDQRTLQLLMEFFRRGTLRFDELSESTLINLGEVADYLKLNRLILQCRKEIATRLKHLQWEETALFAQYRDDVRWLSPLVNLFNF